MKLTGKDIHGDLQMQVKEVLSGWGNYPKYECKVSYPYKIDILRDYLLNNSIPRGMGRSYADQSLGENVIVSKYFNRFIFFDVREGILHAESGITFKDIIETFLPKCWFPYITPGTKYVSIGGAIASDVHGKNHHVEGSFSKYLLGFNIMTPEGEIVYCSRSKNEDLFWATVGGMGLTGFIVDARIRLRRVETSYIYTRTFRVKNIDEMLTVFNENDSKFTYSVAWIDCLSRGKSLGRGVVMFGEHARVGDLPENLKNQPSKITNKRFINLPFYLPNFVLNDLTISLFNSMYYLTHPDFEGFVDYEKFFYPLDSIGGWNKAYGRRGFLQYQFVINDDKVLINILERIVKFGGGSFLAVLKGMGKQEGFMPFGMEGWTLALDFPIKKGLIGFLKSINKTVLEYGGRVYLTKDAILDEEDFKGMYPRYKEWLEVKFKYDPKGIFSSRFSKRIGLSD